MHCDLPQVDSKPTARKDAEHREHATRSNNNDSTLANRQEIVVRSSFNALSAAKGTKKVLMLSDLRDEVAKPPAADSNQSSNERAIDRNQKTSKKDPVLKYHVRLAHSWQHY